MTVDLDDLERTFAAFEQAHPGRGYVRQVRDLIAEHRLAGAEPLELGAPGNCIPCAKPRDLVIGDACLGCRVHYGTATPAQVAAHEYGRAEYTRGFEASQPAAAPAAERVITFAQPWPDHVDYTARAFAELVGSNVHIRTPYLTGGRPGPVVKCQVLDVKIDEPERRTIWTIALPAGARAMVTDAARPGGMHVHIEPPPTFDDGYAAGLAAGQGPRRGGR